MKEDLDIIKVLREEERLGKLTAQSQGSYEELETQGEVLEDMPDESIAVMEDAEKDDFYEEPIQDGDLPSNESVDEKELIFQSSNDLMMYIDKFGKLLKINKAGLAFSGFSEEEVIGKMFWKLPGVFSKGNALKFLNVFKNALKGNPTRNFVGKLDDKLGKTHIMDFFAFPVKENNKLKYVFVVAKELTEQKELEDKYKLISESTSELISLTTFTLNPTLTYVNSAHEDVLGYTSEDLIGKPFFDFVHPDDKKKLHPFIKKYIGAKGKKLLTGKDARIVEHVEFRVKDKAGNWHDLETTTNLMGNEMLSISKDVTDRKKTEEEIKQQSEFLQNAIESLKHPFYVVDVNDYTIKIANSAANLGSSSEKSTCYALTHGYNRPCRVDEHSCPIEEVKKTKKSITVEHIHYDKDGNARNVEVHAHPIFDDKGKVVQIIEYCLDITERKKAEREIKYLKEYNENILESNPNPIIIVKGNQIEYVNNSFISTFGKTKNDYVSKELIEAMPVEIIPVFEELLQDYDKIKELEVKDKSFSVSSFVVKKAEEEEEEEEERIGIILQDITEKKKAQAKVEYQANILQNVNDAIISVDFDFNITSWNKAAEIMYGWKEKEVLGKNSFEVTKLEYSSDNIEKSLDEQIKKFYDVGSWKGNVIQHHKNGKTLQVSISVTFIRDAQGNPVGNVTINRDVTEQKKAQEEISKLSKFPSENKNPVLRVGSDNTIIYANQASKPLLNIWDSEVGNPLPETLKSVTNDAINSKSTKKIEVPCRDVTYLLTFTPVEDEDYVNIYGLDITERKKTEETTKQQNKINTLRAEIWELAAQPLFENELIQQLVDKIGSFFNLEHVSFLRIYPEKKKAIVDIQWRKKDSKSGIGEEFPLWFLKRYFGKPYRVISLRNIPSAAKPIVAPIFKKFDVKSTLLIPYGDIDNPQGYIATADRKADKEWSKDEIDIFSEVIGIILLKSEEIKSEEKAKKHQIKIEQQNIKLKRLDRIKTDFLNATSHELRTPMAAIKGYIQMLLKQTLGDVTPEQKDALNVVLRNTDRLDHLVQDILDISRLESGTMKFIPEKTDISKMIKESLQTMQYNAKMKNIKINTELGKNIPALAIDQERIKQVITNLVDNAIKFSPPNSTVMIRAKKDKNDVLVEVQDFGRGIPKNKQKKIFERFYQVDSGVDRKFGGVGLGLAISQGIVKSHGGNIWVDNSTKDEGSTFRFNLPIDSVENIEGRFKEMDIFELENDK